MVPHISIIRNEDSTIIKYDYLKVKYVPKLPFEACYPDLTIAQTEPSAPAPRDEGIVLSPTMKPTTTGRSGRKPWDDKDWIFDTGATSHVCGNRSLLHHYSSLNPYTDKLHGQAVAHFGPNPIPIVGIGDATLVLPVGENSSSRSSNLFNPSDRNSLKAQALTVKNVMHIPDAGINIISWSQLKKSSKNLNLCLIEENDGVLAIKSKDQPLMRFILRDGLYFLEQAPVALNWEPAK